MYRLTLLIFTALISFPATADWKKMEPRDCAVKAISQILEGGEGSCWMNRNQQNGSYQDQYSIVRNDTLLLSSLVVARAQRYYPHSMNQSGFEKQIKYFGYVKDRFRSASSSQSPKTIYISKPNKKVPVYTVSLEEGVKCRGFSLGLFPANDLEGGTSNRGFNQIMTALVCSFSGDTSNLDEVLGSLEMVYKR